MTAAARAKKPKPVPDRLARVREHQLRALIEELDRALDVNSTAMRAVSGKRALIKAALKHARDYLVELHERNGGSAP